MSFILIRHKNGKPTPIKLSIWDAFKGAPPPKSRLHQCPQCGKFHRPGTKHEIAALAHVPVVESTPGEKNEKTTEESKAGEAPPNEQNFTSEEDAKILEMKAENATWAKIAESLSNGRTKGMVSSRYKQIKPAETKSEEKPSEKPVKEDKKEEKPFEQMSKAEKKAWKAKQAREEGLKKQEEAKAKEKPKATATSAVSEEASPAPALGSTRLPQSNASQSAIKEKQKWIAFASKHFDRTGQRIAPEQARKMAEGTS